jgi:hypothetical protein
MVVTQKGIEKLEADFNKADLSPLYSGYGDNLDMGGKAHLPADQWLSDPSQLIRSRVDTEIGINYKYRGNKNLSVPPAWNRTGREPITYILLYDNLYDNAIVVQGLMQRNKPTLRIIIIPQAAISYFLVAASVSTQQINGLISCQLGLFGRYKILI